MPELSFSTKLILAACSFAASELRSSLVLPFFLITSLLEYSS
ncbi:MAG: hypothetical protein AVDCRST_MAG39-1733 [uncultured Sphingomonadaceae bacterium]|uniref:Uncharacterized protein n=1 Tax=uncultured Sphingomonadaceae bacterium TaxID=169976 RepID=A0A6J4SVZ6_9SPHN|nr:MAG: hypothetical protein AVDCRST_MAG39-1733 [uncultured Sphingomonadaceae bacterium]